MELRADVAGQEKHILCRHKMAGGRTEYTYIDKGPMGNIGIYRNGGTETEDAHAFYLNMKAYFEGGS